MIRIQQLKLEPNHPNEMVPLEEKILSILRIKKEQLEEWKIVKCSIDARKKPLVRKVYSVDVKVRNEANVMRRVGKQSNISLVTEHNYRFPASGSERLEKRPIVIGSGPAGLFCGLFLAEHGYRPLVLERGEDVDSRTRTVAEFWEGKPLNHSSNVQFGEGGAGTFSDGKLNTLVKDAEGRNRKVLEVFVEAGAPKEILYQNKAHIGTDILRNVVKGIRKRIEACGGEVRFLSQVTELEIAEIEEGESDVRETREKTERKETKEKEITRTREKEIKETREEEIKETREEEIKEIREEEIEETRKEEIKETREIRERKRVLTAVIVNDRERIPCQVAVLAIGHSARDTFAMLLQESFSMSAKSFAVGVRIEHPQQQINLAQYGAGDWDGLPAADYKVTYQASNGRSVYSFCMCPGGYVVNASSEEGQIAVNGMSYHSRDGENANSALIVSVTPKDFPDDSPLAGIAFQRQLEKAAYLAGEGKIPLQLFGDFKQNRKSKRLGAIQPNLKGAYSFANLKEVLPLAVSEALEEGMSAFGKKISGFDREDAILSGVESRTSSPVRIWRDAEMESTVSGVYPCGEGAGYAGGITSAAMDGIKIAEAIAKRYAPLE